MEEIQEFLLSHAWAETTKIRYERTLRLLITDIEDLASMDAAAFDQWLKSRGWGNAMIWVNFSAAKQFLNWKFGSQHPALKLRIKRTDSGPQRCLELPQVLELLSSFDTSHPMGIRNLAMCALFLDSGLRVSEICRLTLKQLDLHRHALKVQVKGGDVEPAVFSETTARYLAWWIDERARFAAPKTHQVFIGIGGSTPGQAMTSAGVNCLMRRWVKHCPSIAQLSPHDLRRTFATIATQQGAPERVIAEAGRWKNTSMVKRYTRSLRQQEFLRYSPVSAAMEETSTAPK